MKRSIAGSSVVSPARTPGATRTPVCTTARRSRCPTTCRGRRTSPSRSMAGMTWAPPPRCVCTTRSPFFFNDTATTEIYTLSLHDALPICPGRVGRNARGVHSAVRKVRGDFGELGSYGAVYHRRAVAGVSEIGGVVPAHLPGVRIRSEEHTSELQSHVNLVCRLLLEKKKKK